MKRAARRLGWERSCASPIVRFCVYCWYRESLWKETVSISYRRALQSPRLCFDAGSTQFRLTFREFVERISRTPSTGPWSVRWGSRRARLQHLADIDYELQLSRTYPSVQNIDIHRLACENKQYWDYIFALLLSLIHI